VCAQLIEHNLRGRLQHVLICLYDSNRICQTTVAEGLLHEQMLLEEGASERQRQDVPLTCVVRPSTIPETFNIVISYTSLMLRWWNVSHSQCKLQAHVTLTAAITHLAVLDWPTSTGAGVHTPATDKHEQVLPQLLASSGSSSRKNHHVGKSTLVMSARSSIAPHFSSVSMLQEKLSARDRLSSKQAPNALSGSGPRHLDGRMSVRMMGDDLPNLTPGVSRTRCSFQKRDRFSIDSARRFSISRPSVIGTAEQAAGARTTEDSFNPKDHGCLLIIAFDLIGGMPLYMAQKGRISKVYTCSDHSLEKTVKVEQLLCDGKSVSILLSNGDIRYFEFVIEDDVISITDIPMDQLA